MHPVQVFRRVTLLVHIEPSNNNFSAYYIYEIPDLPVLHCTAPEPGCGCRIDSWLKYVYPRSKDHRPALHLFTAYCLRSLANKLVITYVVSPHKSRAVNLSSSFNRKKSHADQDVAYIQSQICAPLENPQQLFSGAKNESEGLSLSTTLRHSSTGKLTALLRARPHFKLAAGPLSTTSGTSALVYRRENQSELWYTRKRLRTGHELWHMWTSHSMYRARLPVKRKALRKANSATS